MPASEDDELELVEDVPLDDEGLLLVDDEELMVLVLLDEDDDEELVIVDDGEWKKQSWYCLTVSKTSPMT